MTRILAVALLSAMLAGCGSTRTTRTASGAVIGAGTGAAIAGTPGAVVGGLGGAAAGAIIGANQ